MCIGGLWVGRGLPAADAFGLDAGELHESHAWGQIGVTKLAGLQLAIEHTLKRPEAPLRLVTGESDDGSELRGEVVGLALEIARILRKEHDHGAFGSALTDEIDEGFRAALLEHFAGFVEDEEVAEAAKAAGHCRVGLVEEEGADRIEQNEGD